MKWPRGRYNGKRIAGFEIRVVVNVFDWVWWPWFSGWRRYSKRLRWPICVVWLCFLVSVEPEYED